MTGLTGTIRAKKRLHFCIKVIETTYVLRLYSLTGWLIDKLTDSVHDNIRNWITITIT